MSSENENEEANEEERSSVNSDKISECLESDKNSESLESDKNSESLDSDKNSECLESDKNSECLESDKNSYSESNKDVNETDLSNNNDDNNGSDKNESFEKSDSSNEVKAELINEIENIDKTKFNDEERIRIDNESDLLNAKGNRKTSNNNINSPLSTSGSDSSIKTGILNKSRNNKTMQRPKSARRPLKVSINSPMRSDLNDFLEERDLDIQYGSNSPRFPLNHNKDTQDFMLISKGYGPRRFSKSRPSTAGPRLEESQEEIFVSSQRSLNYTIRLKEGHGNIFIFIIKI